MLKWKYKLITIHLRMVFILKIGVIIIQVFHRISTSTVSAYIYIYIYIYIYMHKCVTFGLVGFYGISTIIVYIMPNPLYTYIYQTYMIWLVLFYGILTIVGCDGKLTKIPKRDFIFARVKTGQVGTWSPTEISPVQSSFLRQIRTGILREGII